MQVTSCCAWLRANRRFSVLNSVKFLRSFRIGTNQTKGECMQNLLDEIEIVLLDLGGAGSLIHLTCLNANFFRGCLFDLPM